MKCRIFTDQKFVCLVLNTTGQKFNSIVYMSNQIVIVYKFLFYIISKIMKLVNDNFFNLLCFWSDIPTRHIWHQGTSSS